MQDWTKINIIH